MPASLLDAIRRLDLAALERLGRVHTAFLDVAMALVGTTARGVVDGAGRDRRLCSAVSLTGLSATASRDRSCGARRGLILKPLVSRQRPFETQVELRTVGISPVSRSFPSGHAATAFAGAFVLARMVPGASVPIWFLAVVVAFSRVHLSVHYPLDTIGGALVGLAAAAFVVGGTRWYSR